MEHDHGDVFWQDVNDSEAVEYVARCNDCSWEAAFETRREAEAALDIHERTG